jgi:DNA methylase/Putative DNA-binding domain
VAFAHLPRSKARVLCSRVGSSPRTTEGWKLCKSYGRALIFAENVSEIVVSTRRFQLPKSTADNHESLLFCRASKDSVINEIYITPSASELKARFSYRDMRGQFGIRDITGPFRPALSYPVNGIMPPAGRSWRFTKERFDALVAENRIYYSPKTNRPFLKSYAEEFLGVPAGTTWTDISMHLARSERCGYPAQQPLALMERIVQRATNVEDIVVDPFMGSGTTLAAAANFNRQWIGCDNNPDAISICEERMRGVLASSREIVVPTAEFFEKPVSVSRYSRLTHGLFDAEPAYHFVLDETVACEESRNYEFKEVKGLSASGAIRNTADEYAVAFLNSEGGRILWGIRDSDRVVVGVELNAKLRDDVAKSIENKLANIQPPLSPAHWRIKFHVIYGPQSNAPVKDRFVVELAVPKPDEAALLYGTGSGEVFLRGDSGKKKLNFLEIQSEILRRAAMKQNPTLEPLT